MKIPSRLCYLGLFSLACALRGVAAEPSGSFSAAVEPKAVLTVMEAVADWQLAHPSQHPPHDWTQAAGYTGLMALAAISPDKTYHDAMLAMAVKNEWKPGPRPYHADDHTVCQTYLELYFQHKDLRMLEPTKARFDHLIDHASIGDLRIDQPDGTDRWSWCDALFMSPPAWVRLWAATGDERYLDWMLARWWETTAYLYDPVEHLYTRDNTYFPRREANGRKIFWSRGNGWVLAGLARVLPWLPPAHPQRPRLEQLFRDMAASIVACQQEDGLWRASLLDPASFPMKETSGSGFFTYGLTWGINNGYLDRAGYEPAVRKAWAALVACVAADGKLTHVQPIGQTPVVFDADLTEIYGVGAFLLAGSEMHRLAGGEPAR